MTERPRSDRAPAPTGFLSKLVHLQVDRPLWVLLLALLLTVPAVLLARGLELRTGFEALLPESKPSVQELKRVGARTAGVSSLSIVADVVSNGAKGDPASSKLALQRFGDALLPQLRALGPEWVGTAEDGVQAEKEFLKRRQALFLSLEKVQELHDKIEDRFDYEVNGSLLDDGPVPEPITRASIEKMLRGDDKPAAADAPAGPPYPDGYYMNAEGTRLVVLVRTPVETGDLTQTATLRKKVEDVVAAVNPTSFDKGMKVSYTGDVVTSAEQYGAVKNDLASVGAVGIGLILGITLIFFLRIRSVLTMGLAIGIGVMWTFGVTRLVIGHLNTASGFLVSIVFGNGINFGILYRARFDEARRAGEGLREAVAHAYRDTWRPTLTVAAASGAGYLSLATTTFRGFKHFGVIGGYGMVLCWIANYAFMPPLIVLMERIWPTGDKKDRRGIAGALARFVDRGVPFGAPYSAFARWVPARLTAIVGLALAVGAGVLTYRYVKNDPLEYDTGKLGNDAVGGDTPAAQLSEEVDALVGRSGQDGMAVMLDRIDQVQPYVDALRARSDAAPADKKPFEKVVSIFSLIPEQQKEKIALLAESRQRIDRIHQLHKIDEADWKELEPNLPPKDITPFGIAELPERVARPFTEKDGRRGLVVYIVPKDGRSVKDVHYLLLWADSFRETKLPTGETILGTGRAVIFADMIQAVIDESPRAIALSLAMTALVVVLAFYRGKHGLRAIGLVLASLLVGIAWMGASLALGHVKINFLNFIAVPITFGIGVDYAVNVVHRWRLEGPGSVVQVVRETGGAVVLCSLTTTLGYLALLTSINGAVRSFGLAAVIGEVTCLTAAVVVLPAVLIWIDGTKSRAAQPPDATSS